MGYSHGTKWDDELIEEKIMECVKALDLDHFPTHAEMEGYYGNKSLSSTISKGKGTLFWAQHLGLGLSYSETTFGNEFERIAINDIYENTEYCSVKTSQNFAYDLLVDNSIKVDVKVSKIFTSKTGTKTYSFNLEKKEPTCDVFILYCLNDDSTVRHILIIPSCALMGQTQVGVGMENSKWLKYKDKWELLHEYSDFFRSHR